MVVTPDAGGALRALAASRESGGHVSGASRFRAAAAETRGRPGQAGTELNEGDPLQQSEWRQNQ
jgi:hypothetical protein